MEVFYSSLIKGIFLGFQKWDVTESTDLKV